MFTFEKQTEIETHLTLEQIATVLREFDSAFAVNN